jgi:hypothetical protein
MPMLRSAGPGRWHTLRLNPPLLLPFVGACCSLRQVSPQWLVEAAVAVAAGPP